MYKIQEETNLNTVVECMTLGGKHYNEVEQRSAQHPFKLNTNFFKIMIDAGIIHLMTARDTSNKLLGYFCTMVSPDLFSQEFVAREIGIYVEEGYRNGRVFIKLMKAMEEKLTTNGVGMNVIMFKHGHNEKLPLKLGYRASEIVYEKILEDTE